MRSNKEKITEKAIEILRTIPDGVRYSELARLISKEFQDIPINTILGTIVGLEKYVPDKVVKPSRGLFQYIDFYEKESLEVEDVVENKKIKEEDFYEPFAKWLVNDLEECVKAIPLGGNLFKDKWGTPDVVGKWEPRRTDIIKANSEIVTAEIKLNTRELITAFGQACSYKLFSHKSYLVIPKDSPENDISRLDSLCLIFGIGLVLFDRSNLDDPQFEIRVRPLKHEPDMFYVNKYMKLIEKDLFE